MASTYVSGTVAMTMACRHYTGAMVTLTVPTSGVIVVSAQVGLYVAHTNGVASRWFLYVEDVPGQCTDPLSLWDDSIPSEAATDGLIERSAFLMLTYPTGPGTYTFFLNGQMWGGAGPGDWFESANLVAVFYPL